MSHDQGAVDPPERMSDMTKYAEHTIWDSRPDYEDWRADMEAEYPEMTEDERYGRMLEINADYLDDERANLNVPMGMPILLIADIGHWDGRYSGYGVIRSGNIRDCLRSDMDDCRWYVDELRDLRCRAAHHDGVNNYLYRVFKDGVTTEQMDNLLYKIYCGTATRRDIMRLTRRLGDAIAEVYGWT